MLQYHVECQIHVRVCASLDKMLKDPLMGLGFGTQWCVNIKLNYKLV